MTSPAVPHHLLGPRFRVLTLLWVALALPPATAEAQAPPPARADAFLAHIDSLWLAGDAGAGLEALRDTLAARDSTGYALLWRAARAAATMGRATPFQSGVYRRQGYFDEAIVWGERAEAAATAPGGDGAVEGGYWLGLALGLRALDAAPRDGVVMAQRLWDLGHRLLERAPDDPRPHSLLGRLHLEVLELSSLERFIGRFLVDAEVIGRVDWDVAERHLTRAVELSPGDPGFLLGLALLHEARGRREAARLLAMRAAESPILGAGADLDRAAARDFLAELIR